jgi:hypothetical protein
MSLDFSPVFTELSSCKSKDELKTFLLQHKFTFKYHDARKLSDDGMVTLDNEYIYVVKHPYKSESVEPPVVKPSQDDDEPPVVKLDIENKALDLLHKFGRGIVFRVNFNTDVPTYVLMSLPLPFGDTNYLDNYDLKDSIVTGLVDGTGFNVSLDPVSNLLFVSTRACGGYYPEGPTNHFNNPEHRYGNMFQEALNKYNDIDKFLSITNHSLHFVMLHPHDVKIYPVEESSLHLVNVYEINDNKATFVPVVDFQLKNNTTFDTPIDLEINTRSGLDDVLSHSNANITPGVKIFHPESGVWSKRIMTHNYTRIKELLGNDTNILFTLIRLRHTEGQYRKHMFEQHIAIPENHKSVISELLEYFPGYSNMYSMVTNLCKHFTSDLFDNYLHVYTRRDSRLLSEKLQTVPHEMNDLVRRFHENYKIKRTEYQQKYDECKTDEEKAELIRPKTTHRDAMGFVNNLPPAMIYDRFRQFVTRKNSEVAMPGMMKYFPKKP